MTLGTLDLLTFLGFIALVIGVSLFASRREETSSDYFLAGRTLPWWLIGFSLIASNISTEHFVGMAGRGAEIGLAIASYEWMAAVTLVIVATVFLPRFLRAGIYTIPQYLEIRYSATTRTIMAVFMLVAYVFVAMATVLYAGALAIEQIFAIDRILAIWLIGLLAGAYTVYGGLKAVVWSDLLQGVALLLGGILITVLGLRQVGGLGAFLASHQDKLHTVLPWNHPEMPWLAVFVGGLWIPNLFYMGTESVHHPAYPRRQEPGRGATRDLSCRGHQAGDSVHHHLPRYHGRRAVRRADHRPGPSISGADARVAPGRPHGDHVCGVIRRGDEQP